MTLHHERIERVMQNTSDIPDDTTNDTEDTFGVESDIGSDTEADIVASVRRSRRGH
ncbi:hypothetical protein [Isoptericola sediminis]|uniref:Uncharacterized protein n=1 Tax=Isoptericola sediminis TaxID=2733572 RepID=A0A849JW18_9MICO|nr:hypothetical protein [Isoptericola sediminis]NNU26794.1 hypothetical protein [Isoptericola sediminis]